MKKQRLSPPYLTIEEHQGYPILYSDRGDYSVVLHMTNPVKKYASDAEGYYKYNEAITSLIKTLGTSYAIQKHDIFSRVSYSPPQQDGNSFLSQRYFEYFEGRLYIQHQTYLTITQEKQKGFLQFNASRWKDFFDKISKTIDLISGYGWQPEILDKAQLETFIHRYFAIDFRHNSFSIENIKAGEKSLSTSQKLIKSTSLINIDEMDMPSYIYPLCVDNYNGSDYCSDLFSFLSDFKEADDVIYHQCIFIPNQRGESARLATKKNRHASLPSAGNAQAVEDIALVEDDVERNNKLFVYAHYNIITSGKNIDKTINFFEAMFAKRNIRVSQANFNQMELFMSSLPGCSYHLNPDYDRFLTLHDVAGCLMYKEREEYDEDTPLKIYYTNRTGIPKAIDITGKEGRNRLTTNSNFFCLGPSGSGKSFHMNGVVRQLYEQDTDIVLVDTGHSYEGICNYFGGKYITYREDKPISMNPFKISKEELNIEKINFLKSLIYVIWKGADGSVSPIEEEFIHRVIEAYYRFYFNPFDKYSNTEYEQRKKILMLEARNQRKERISETAEDIRYARRRERAEKIKALSERGVDGERDNALSKLEYLKDLELSQDDYEGNPLESLLKYEIEQEEEILRNIKVTELSFNGFFEFALEYIPFLSSSERIPFDLDVFRFLLSKFYRGGAQERTLNEDMDTTLFNENFIVFEIDAIKDDPKLFPIVTLIIMDVFLQKMRLKKNRKALIIEEAWKALASDLMAEYIKYLYKTVRKFWGIVGVVTQEVEDIISSDVVKNAILNNSEITILLDQAKLKDRFDDIKGLLGLTETECAKIWTINNLNNTDGRGAFKEVYIRRGSYGEVYGVEESPQSYMAYTTERVEKDALMHYLKNTGDISLAIERFCKDWQSSGISKIMDFAKTVGK